MNLRSARPVKKQTCFDTLSKMPTPEKIHAELEKAGADPDFVRFMISREDLDGEYYDRVFGGEDSDSDVDVSDDAM